MNLNLTDKVAIITGASRGIGRAIAQRLSAEGMKLVIAARTESLLDEVAQSCATEVLPVALDLREATAAQNLIDRAVAHFGGVDVLVNNAGATKRGEFLTLSEDDWTDGFALKFFSSVRCARAAWPHLQTRHGAIINIIGVGGRTGSAEFAIGGSVNAALMNLTKVLADKGLAEGVKVNAINPGSIATERLKTRIATVAAEQNLSPEAAATKMASKLGVARFGTPDEIARAVAYLASDASSYCQGAILDVDGGQTRTL